MSEPEEHVLAGGNVSDVVVRIGETVRKPALPQTPAVEAFLSYLHAAGFSGAPRTLGRDERGRHVLEYVPGQLAHGMPPMDLAGLRRVGRLIREFHDVAEGFTPPPDARWDVCIPPDRSDLICHHDLAPWNLVCDGDRWVFIDWDGAGPGSRLWDLAWTATGFVPLDPSGDPAEDARGCAQTTQISTSMPGSARCLSGKQLQSAAAVTEPLEGGDLHRLGPSCTGPVSVAASGI